MKTKSDPTGRARSRRKAERLLISRLNVAEKQVKRLFRDIPRTRQPLQTNESFFNYEYGPQVAQALKDRVGFILDEQLLDGQQREAAANWYWSNMITQEYTAGVMEEVNFFNQLLAGAVAAGVIQQFEIPPVSQEQIIFSQGFRESVDTLKVEQFSLIQSLSEGTKGQVLGVIDRGIAAGESPNAIAKEISGRFDVAESRAKTIARTETHKVFVSAKMDATDMLSDVTGLETKVRHISALLPTTRPNHAARHEKIYTTMEQRRWWAKDHNLINCYCDVEPVYETEDGQVINVDQRR